jgi:hypothetical protein
VIRGQALDQPGLPAAQAADQALGHAHPVGHMVHDLVPHDVQVQRPRELQRHILGEGTHFLGHCNDRHG